MENNPLISVNDLTGLSQPITKLIDVVSRGIGKLYEPVHQTRLTKAHLKDLLLVSQAIKDNPSLAFRYHNDNLSIESPAMAELAKRTAERMAFQEITKQQNIEAVIDVAYNSLSQETNVSEEPVETDWIMRFMNSVDDISDKQMQELWGKILAGEIAEPNSFSFRTLEMVKNISHQEALIFQNVCKLALQSRGRAYLSNKADLLKAYGVTYPDLMMMEECGLLSTNAVNWTVTTVSSQPTGIFNGNLVWLMGTNSKTPIDLHLVVYAFTICGKQLLKIIAPETKNNFLLHFASLIKTEQLALELSHSVREIIETNLDGDIRFGDKDLLADYETSYLNVISPSARETLFRNGIVSLEDLRKQTKKILLALEGFDEISYQKLIDSGYILNS